MPYLLAGVFLLWIGHSALRSFLRLPPAAAAVLLRRIGAIVAFVLAGLLLLRGRFEIALPLGMFGIWLMGWRSAASWGRFSAGRAKRAAGATSRVRSAMIEMELDHDTGTMRGHVLAGSYQDHALDLLTRQECLALRSECLRDDPDGARLLEAYLDRRFPRWRSTGEANTNAGGSSRGPPAGPMGENEAYEVLGLRKGATRDEITRAHRALMKKLHPDHGGSTHLAARANEAKDILMRRHT
jgi:hypothetical protein